MTVKTQTEIKPSRILRPEIIEEPLDQSWKIRYLYQLKKSRETGRPLKEIIDADEVQIQRFSLRSEK